ncbi:MAG TPA: DNA cytosine methyltransferase [Thermoplasmata archaeon]|nr:DNA cytosine methyltransferase [Thermoplasmata archaeon]
MTRTIHALDAFCGAGGTSTGLALASGDLRLNVDLLAVNHWSTAVATHSRNHPWARHLQSRIESVRPRDAFPGGRLNLLVASPECTHHSTARGGRPVSDQLRASAWHLIPWLEELTVDAILVENVPEFESWCRVGRNGRPVKKEKGAYFLEWVRALRIHGYNVDWRVVNSADFGDATSRRRLFVMARRGNRPIVWPRPTCSRGGKAPGTRSWRAARDIIDWSLKGKSIFDRERPLAPRTIARIIEGLRRFGGHELRPFLILMEHGGGTRSVGDPLPTITTARGGSMGVAEPFTVGVCGRNLAPKGVSDPLPTLTHRSTRWLIESEVQPFTVTTDRPETNRSLPRSTEEPIATVVANNERIALAQPFILSQGSGGAPRSTLDPVPTIPAGGAHALVEPFIVPNFGERKGQAPRTHPVSEPLPSVTSHGAGALVEPFLTGYYSTGGSQVSSIDAPVPALPTHDRFALVQPVVNGRALDIRFRMLEPRELAAAMGFPSDYAFTGNRTDVVRQIGNAVAVQTARWLCRALLEAPSASPLAVIGPVEATA